MILIIAFFCTLVKVCYCKEDDPFTFPEDVRISFHFTDSVSEKAQTAEAHEWMELLTPETAVSLAEYVDSLLSELFGSDADHYLHTNFWY